MITVKLPDPILTALRTTGLTTHRTTGLTTHRAAELLGVGPRQAAHLMRKAGAKPSHNVLGKWRMGAE